jgi:hypothetical protein
MEQPKPIRIIAIDAETGLYWKENRILRNIALIKAAIAQEAAKRFMPMSNFHGNIF